MRCFGSLSVLLVSCLSCHAAHADPMPPGDPQPPVEVTANYIGGTATIPFFMMSAFHISQQEAAHIDDITLDMTKDQVCQTLRDNKPSGCTTQNYPPAPGIQGASRDGTSGAVWAGNGCGADPWSSAEGDIALSILLPGIYSGDLNRPLKGNPSIDFTVICNDHDRGYTSRFSKTFVDNRFSRALDSFCSGSTNQQLCNGFAATYVDAVKKYGPAAYAADQAQLKCAVWGDSMKKNQCGA